MTGAELKAHRIAAGLTQTQLAEAAGFARGAVAYWERKAEVDGRWGAPREFCTVLGVRFFPTNARPRSLGLMPEINIPALWEPQAMAALARLMKHRRRRRVLCGAKTRKATPCQRKSEPGKTRCKLHGGKSTGPKTPEGKARIAEAQRARWTKWQADRQLALE